MAQQMEWHQPLVKPLLLGAITPLQAWEMQNVVEQELPAERGQLLLVQWINLLNSFPQRQALQ